MDAHTNFDPNGFSKSAAANIFGVGLALTSAMRSAVANAQALADIDATERTVDEWHATVQALVKVLVATQRQNGELARVLTAMTAKNRELELEVQALQAAI
ncbi:MAG: hypothetical protein K2Y27_35210 [Xanthobacteraceae bacterium]|nr:hypothetical protein [Xanthobacteraceae bacterium]